MSWTDERIATLKKMWKDGHSAADIAATLGKGVTRNAVIGKAHRMGLSGRPSPIKTTASSDSGKKAAKPVKAAAVKAAPPAPAKKTAAKVEAVKASPKKAEVKAPVAAKKDAKDAKKEKASSLKKAARKNAAVTQEEIEDLRLGSDTPPPGGGVALIDLSEKMCKWPFGDPKEEGFTFCGKEIYPGKPYCPEHVLVAYQSSARSRAAARLKEAEEDEIEVDIDDVVEESDIEDDDAVGAVD